MELGICLLRFGSTALGMIALIIGGIGISYAVREMQLARYNRRRRRAAWNDLCCTVAVSAIMLFCAVFGLIWSFSIA